MNTVSTIQNIANALGWTLVHFLWQGALIFLAYWIITKLFCKNRINLHYWIGMFFMLLCLILPVYEFITQLNSSVTSGVLHELRIQVSSLGDNGILSTKEMIVTLIQMSIPYIVLFWGVSVLLISSHLFKSWLALIKLSKQKSDNIPSYLAKKFNIALKQLKLKLNPLIIISNKIDIPATFGYFKPVILIPAAMILKLPQEQMEAILLHELCHIKRADFLHNIIQLLVETLFFYHPLTRWISRDIRKVREQCCDKLVLDLGASPMVYAKALTNIALIQNSLTTPHLQIAANDGELFERIKFLMLKKQSKSPSITILSVIIISFAFFIIVNNILNNTHRSDIQLNTSTPINSEITNEVKKPNFSIIDALTGLTPKFEEESNAKTDSEAIVISKPNKSESIVVKKEINNRKSFVLSPTEEPITTEAIDNNSVTKSNTPEPIRLDKLPKDFRPLILPTERTAINSSNYPKLIRMVNPEYNKLARSRGIEGTVILSFNIDEKGKVNNINVDKSSPLKLLDGNARQALRKWRFAPESINQNIINNRYQQIFSFNLDEIGNCIDGDIGTRLAKDKVCK
jgi:TonB family protein